MTKRIFSLLVVMLLSTSAVAKKQGGPLSNPREIGDPVWEAGMFGAYFRDALYPASADSQHKLLPVPFFIYRGEYLRIGDDAIVKAVAVEKERIKVDLSLSGAFNSDSEDSEIRRGMPDLDFLFEMGPEVSLRLNDSTTSELWLNIQLRGVFSTDFSGIDHHGYVFEPEFSWESDQIGIANTTFFISAAPIFATEKTHEYFYQVDEVYATDFRPAYDAGAGYLGTKTAFSLKYEHDDDITVFAGVRFGIWSGSVNADSPLYQDSFTYGVGLGVKWRLFVSERKVK
ncbi:MipA/OmpV family protein [Thalassotalea mangrovi]|uniref:MipA/OmpV family protein n=1 Tax=Thalassotalea mangrovi TaxID=2572245 RepID=A0A4U1B3E5_9GAMM|nr:MipA/OmpV family protein [Thalassotalea mangrovi]TKB44218.1 MipA/OmpV family protein [Thalassotalea mangrovi]